MYLERDTRLVSRLPGKTESPPEIQGNPAVKVQGLALTRSDVEKTRHIRPDRSP